MINPGKTELAERDVRETPRKLYNELHEEFRFTLDAAASHENALCDLYYTEGGLWLKKGGGFQGAGDGTCKSGLPGSWADHSVFCNPPFTMLLEFTDKAWAEFCTGCVPSIVMLVPANRTEQEWWQKNVAPYVKQRGFDVRWRDERDKFTVDGGQPIYKRDKAGNICYTKKGKPIIGSASFACALLIWSEQ